MHQTAAVQAAVCASCLFIQAPDIRVCRKHERIVLVNMVIEHNPVQVVHLMLKHNRGIAL